MSEVSSICAAAAAAVWQNKYLYHFSEETHRSLPNSHYCCCCYNSLLLELQLKLRRYVPPVVAGLAWATGGRKESEVGQN